MATADDELRRRYKEFLDLMPLTLALAGLSLAEGNRNFTPEQLDARRQVVLNAFKLARQVAREALQS